MRTGDGFLCVYSIILEPSFAAVRSFYDHILRVKDVDTLPFILVGNKADLEAERVVSKEDGENLSKDLGCRFMEASAKTRQNVTEIFHELVREIKKFQTPVVDDVDKVVKPKKKGCVLL